MFYLYFPGNSPLNRNELEEFANMFKENQLKYFCQEWIHWSDEKKAFDLKQELEVTKKVIKESESKEFIIIGKSIGTMFGSKVAEVLGDRLKAIFLLGIPSQIYQDNTDVYSKLLENRETQKYIFQNVNDPYGDIEATREYAQKGLQLFERNFDDHKYSVSKEVEEIIHNI